MGHQKAAYEILTNLYTPQSITQNETLRKALNWYIRFDLFVGFQSGSEAVLGIEWVQANHQYYQSQVQERPNELGPKYEERFAYGKLTATQVALLFSKKTKGQISDEEFVGQVGNLLHKLDTWLDEVSPELLNPELLVKDFSDCPERDPDDIVDPYDPNTLWGGEIFTTNFMFADIWSVELMFKSLLALAEGKPSSPEVVALAYKQIQKFESVRLYPHKPYGSLLEVHASFAVASLFMPKDDKHIMWCRKRFAAVESLG
jgi:hypothetical protein